MSSSVSSTSAMQLSKLSWRHSPYAAVRSDLVVVTPPSGNLRPGLRQGLEPVFVQALVPELAVEALDVAVLHGAAWLDQDVLDAMLLSPSDEHAACELRAVVGSHSSGIAPEPGGLIQQARHVQTADPIKPHIERFFASLNYLTLVRGRIHKRVANVVNLDPKKDAAIKFSDLVKGLLMFVSDVHPFEINERKLARPYDLYVQGLERCPPVAYPGDMDSFKLVTGLSKTLTVSQGGVQLHGLVRVPSVLPFEAFSSWLCRMALAQGVSTPELCRYFGLNFRADIDREAFGAKLTVVRELCGLPQSAFWVHDRLMTSMFGMQCAGKGLLANVKNKSRFRFCPLCVKAMPQPYFPIHWRFVPWRWCPEHDCMLEAACPHCAAPLVLPVELAGTSSSSRGLGSLSRCLKCSGRLASREPCLISNIPTGVISAWESMQLGNGRAVLAALFEGTFRLAGEPGRFQLVSLNRIRKDGAFSNRFDSLSADGLRLRAQSHGQK